MGEHRILIILPAYNEEGKIGSLVRKTKNSIATDTFVGCDGCTDNTPKEAEEAGAIVSYKPERTGIGAAIRRGIDYAMENNYDVCVIMGGDDQDDPQELPNLIKKLDEGYDFVIGSRYIPGGKTVNQPFFRLLTTKTYSVFFSVLTRKWLTDASNGYRAFRTDMCRDLNIWRPELDHYELEPTVLYDAVRRFRFDEAPVTKYYHVDKSFSKMRPFYDWYAILKPVMKKFYEDVSGKPWKRAKD